MSADGYICLFSEPIGFAFGRLKGARHRKPAALRCTKASRGRMAYTLDA